MTKPVSAMFTEDMLFTFDSGMHPQWSPLWDTPINELANRIKESSSWIADQTTTAQEREHERFCMWVSFEALHRRVPGQAFDRIVVATIGWPEYEGLQKKYEQLWLDMDEDLAAYHDSNFSDEDPFGW